jgi:hypothetical protein
MTDRTIDLDGHRGMAAQKATLQRRMLADVEAKEEALRLQRRELEEHLLVAPAANWHEAAAKARYLLTLFADSPTALDHRRQQLIASVLADFTRLSGDTAYKLSAPLPAAWRLETATVNGATLSKSEPFI